ncbi:MAG: MATE family efflux transporter [Tenericutes bacterium]|nr:MATE family efflux transporter [Mycoplasmatota bacterium]
MKKVFNLTEGSILKKLLLVALPVLLTAISQMAYNLTDMFWIGRVDQIGLIESDAVTAVGTVSYMLWLSFGFILISKIGTSVKISHSVGKNRIDDIDTYATNGILMQFFLGLFVSATILIFKEEFLAIFNLDNQNIVNYALMYAPIVGGFIFFQFLNNGFASINEGLGQTKINLIILAIGFILNIIMDPLFILVFRMGIQGAAIATVISQFVTLIIFIIVYKTHNPSIKIFNLKNFNLKAMKQIARIGFPTFVHSILFTGISIYIGVMIVKFGDAILGAQRIGSQVEQLTWMIGGGFQAAITVFVGQNIAANQLERVKKGIIYISAILIPYSVLVTALLYFKAEWLMRIFMDDPEAVAHGAKYIRIISLSQIFMMIEAVGTGLFYGLGKSAVPSANGIIGNVIRIPLAIILSATLLETGIWWAINISSIFKGTVMLIATIYIISRLEKIKLRNLTKSSEEEVVYG